MSCSKEKSLTWQSTLIRGRVLLATCGAPEAYIGRLPFDVWYVSCLQSLADDQELFGGGKIYFSCLWVCVRLWLL